MKKLFSIAIAVLAITLTLSSCKKDELTDGQLKENIIANCSYKGDFKFQGDKYDCLMTFVKEAGVTTFAIIVLSEELPYEDAGVWDVVNGGLKMDGKHSYTGTITKNGDKLNIESGTITFDMEKYTPKK